MRPPPTLVDTLISLAFGFVLAFAFRGFFVEPFVIPTGSMAPTLLGRHVVVGDARTGTWPVDVRAVEGRGSSSRPEFVHHPVTAEAERLSEDGVIRSDRRVRNGERVLALKHAYALRAPRRWEVVVFQDPSGKVGADAVIKRLIGLPGESVALVDGDVFVAPAGTDWAGASGVAGTWSIAPKPVGVQRALWQRVWEGPVGGSASVWSAEGGALIGGGFEVAAGSGSLVWDTGRGRPLADRLSYNQIHPAAEGAWHGPFPTSPFHEVLYPVGDAAMSARVAGLAGGGRVVATMRRNGRAWRGVLTASRVSIERLITDGEGDGEGGGGWEELASGQGVVPGAASSVASGDDAGIPVSFWHSDQTLRLLVDGEVVCEAAYGGGIDERLAIAMRPDYLRSVRGVRQEQVNTTQSVLSRPEAYATPTLSWSIETGSRGPVVRLEGLSVDRDVWFRPYHNPGAPDGHRVLPLGVHPDRPADLGAGEYFVLGDNSAASSDSRYWDAPSPSVSKLLNGPAVGVLPKELIIGRAAAVYLPSPAPVGDRGRRLPGFDLGRIRWIR